MNLLNENHEMFLINLSISFWQEKAERCRFYVTVSRETSVFYKVSQENECLYMIDSNCSGKRDIRNWKMGTAVFTLLIYCRKLDFSLNLPVI